MSDLERLRRHLADGGPTLLGYSGGVDSALLAVVAREALGTGRFLAVIGRSPSYPAAQYAVALDIARRFDVPLRELDTHELDDPAYAANPVNRCYFCKRELWARLHAVAAERGFARVIDGTNADDAGEHRPGLQAAAERRVGSPLLDLGWTKAMVRDAARALGLPIWDAPAQPCLASRVAYGLPVTPGRLRQVEEAEALLRRRGVRGDLRVRHHGDRARVEVTMAERPLVEAAWPEVEPALRALGFAQVELDPRGYRRGGLLEILPAGTGAA